MVPVPRCGVVVPPLPQGRVRRALAVAVALVVATGGLSGCAAGEIPTALPSINLPTVTVTPPTLPGSDESNDSESTREPPEAPVEEAPGENTPDTDSGLPLWAWILIGMVIVVGVLAWIGRTVSSRRDAKVLAENVIARGKWVVDQGTGALMSAQTPDTIQRAWSQLDGALVDLTTELRRLELSARGERAAHVREIRDAVAAVRMTAEADAQARLSGASPSGSSGAAEGLFTARRRLADVLIAFDPERAES